MIIHDLGVIFTMGDELGPQRTIVGYPIFKDPSRKIPPTRPMFEDLVVPLGCFIVLYFFV